MFAPDVGRDWANRRSVNVTRKSFTPAQRRAGTFHVVPGNWVRAWVAHGSMR